MTEKCHAERTGQLPRPSPTGSHKQENEERPAQPGRNGPSRSPTPSPPERSPRAMNFASWSAILVIGVEGTDTVSLQPLAASRFAHYGLTYEGR